MNSFVTNTQYKPLNNKETKKLIIYTGTTSPVKVEAVTTAFLRIYPDYDCEIIGVEVPSNVPEQPIGKKETLDGCNNRLNNLLKYVTDKDLDYDFLVTMENGIFIEDDYDGIACYDACFICIRYCRCRMNKYEFSEKVYFPYSYYLETIKTDQTKTIGELLQRDRGYDSKSWHHHFSDNRKTRKEIFSQTVYKSIQYFIQHFIL